MWIEHGAEWTRLTNCPFGLFLLDAIFAIFAFGAIPALMLILVVSSTDTRMCSTRLSGVYSGCSSKYCSH